MKKNNLFAYSVLWALMSLVIVTACKDDEDDPTPDPGPTFMSTTYQDTVMDYLERSADGVFHVANNPALPSYQRYFFGTNENWTDVAQHFDFPAVRSTQSGATVDKVEMTGFQVRVAVLQPMGPTDDITYTIYAADANGMPEGDALHSGTFSPNIGAQDVTLHHNVTLDDPDGYLISFHTYDQPGDDIFVVNNSYCVVSGGPNDGRGERRTKVRKSDGSWEDLIDNGPSLTQDPGEEQLMLDCDMYVFPYLTVTEKYPQ